MCKSGSSETPEDASVNHELLGILSGFLMADPISSFFLIKMGNYRHFGCRIF